MNAGRRGRTRSRREASRATTKTIRFRTRRATLGARRRRVPSGTRERATWESSSGTPRRHPHPAGRRRLIFSAGPPARPPRGTTPRRPRLRPRRHRTRSRRTGAGFPRRWSPRARPSWTRARVAPARWRRCARRTRTPATLGCAPPPTSRVGNSGGAATRFPPSRGVPIRVTPPTQIHRVLRITRHPHCCSLPSRSHTSLRPRWTFCSTCSLRSTSRAGSRRRARASRF